MIEECDVRIIRVGDSPIGILGVPFAPSLNETFIDWSVSLPGLVPQAATSSHGEHYHCSTPHVKRAWIIIAYELVSV